MKKRKRKSAVTFVPVLADSGMNEAFPRRVYMSKSTVSGNAYEITFVRVKVPAEKQTVIVIALNIEEAACKLRQAWKDDFSHFVELKSLSMRAIA